MRRGLFVVCLVQISVALGGELDFAGVAGNSAGNETGRAAGKSGSALNTNSMEVPRCSRQSYQL
jgi:hypothetical protein